ncbi:hypothetical protein V6N13_035012 [Hibiscus sabdariffa]
MALRFPRFSQGLAQDPTTRRIWFGIIATAHDFESHDDITEERLYQNIFASHFGQLAIIFLWTSGNLFHVAWQGNFEAWVQDPLHVRPIAHAIWDPHFGQPAVEAFTRGGAPGPVNIAYSGVYQWWYTIGLRTNEDLYTGAVFLLFLSALSLIAGWLHLQPKWKPSVSWFKNAESRLNHHLSGLFGVSSLAWTGHLVHVAIPGSRGEYVRWNNFLDVLPHPQGLGPFFSGQWNLYAQNPDSSSHLFGTSQGSGTAILTLLGGFHPQTQSLWLTDIAHHHLAIAFLFLVAGHMYRTNFGIGHSIKDLLEAHIPPGGRLGRGHKGLYDTINNSIHFQLGLALASLGVITSLVAQHMYSLPAYAFIAQDFTTQAALYTHHQYIAGFIMTGAFAHGAIFFIRDYNPEQNEDNVLARMDNGVEGSGHVHSVDRDQRSLESPRPRSYPSFLHSSFEPPIQSINLSTCLSAFVATWAELFTSSSTRNEIPFTGSRKTRKESTLTSDSGSPPIKERLQLLFCSFLSPHLHVLSMLISPLARNRNQLMDPWNLLARNPIYCISNYRATPPAKQELPSFLFPYSKQAFHLTEIVAHHTAHQLHLPLWEARSGQVRITYNTQLYEGRGWVRNVFNMILFPYLFDLFHLCPALSPMLKKGKTALLWAQEAKGMSSAASPPHLFFSVPAPHALRAPLALCSPLILHWTIRMDFAALHLSESRPGPARVVPTTGGEHLSIRSRAVTGSPITPKANFNSPNQGSSRVVIVDSYKDIE